MLASAKKAGQTVAFGLMPTGSAETFSDSPIYLYNNGVKGYNFTWEGGLFWVPDMEDPRAMAAYTKLIAALGKKYGNDPRWGLTDVRGFGLWGENHFSATKVVGTDKEVPLPSDATQKKVVAAWTAAFPNKLRVQPINSGYAGSTVLKYAVTTKGTGWRADCLGDYGFFSPAWNHMENYYPQVLASSNANNTWKKAPVAFESCGDMNDWVAKGYSVRKIFDYALSYHASFINNRSKKIPAGYKSEVERLLRKLGYRLVVKKVDLLTFTRGKTASISVTIDNVGVAPPYLDYKVSLRLGGKKRISGVSVKGWLPGSHKSTISLSVPSGLKVGTSLLELAITDAAGNAVIKMANSGRSVDGWYPIARVSIK